MNVKIISRQTIWFCTLISVVYGKSPNKIHGGEIGSIERYPYVVSIQYHDYHVCGGVIISELHILTVASCILAENNVVYGNIKILSGTNDLEKDDRIVYWRIYDVAYVIIHERYDPQRNWINDIAILKLTSPMSLFKLRDKVPLVALKARRNGFHLVGWGVNPMTGVLLRYLQMLWVRSIPPAICKMDYYNDFFFTPAQFCLFPHNTDAKITQGSGGSPIMMGKKIVGLISFLSVDQEKPPIYTLAPHYEPWLESMKQKV